MINYAVHADIDAQRRALLTAVLGEGAVLGDLDFSSLGQEYTGMITPPARQHELRKACDMLDGLAKVTGSIGTIAFQNTGSTRMTIGFNTETGGIVRATQLAVEKIGPHAVIWGSREAAASSIAAAVQLGAKEITVVLGKATGPGSALVAAAQMGVEPGVLHALPNGPFDALFLADEKVPEGAERAEIVVDVVGALADGLPAALVHRKVVPATDVLAFQVQDQIRLLTGKNSNGEELRTLARR